MKLIILITVALTPFNVFSSDIDCDHEYDLAQKNFNKAVQNDEKRAASRSDLRKNNASMSQQKSEYDYWKYMCDAHMGFAKSLMDSGKYYKKSVIHLDTFLNECYTDENTEKALEESLVVAEANMASYPKNLKSIDRFFKTYECEYEITDFSL